LTNTLIVFYNTAMKSQKFIKESRKKLNLTQKALANKLKIHRYNVAKYETGKSMPPGDIILSIMELLNLSKK